MQLCWRSKSYLEKSYELFTPRISFSSRPGKPSASKSHHTMADPRTAARAADAGGGGAGAAQAGAAAQSDPGSQASSAGGPPAAAGRAGLAAAAARGSAAGRAIAVGSDVCSMGSSSGRGPSDPNKLLAALAAGSAASGTIARAAAGSRSPGSPGVGRVPARAAAGSWPAQPPARQPPVHRAHCRPGARSGTRDLSAGSPQRHAQVGVELPGPGRCGLEGRTLCDPAAIVCEHTRGLRAGTKLLAPQNYTWLQSLLRSVLAPRPIRHRHSVGSLITHLTATEMPGVAC